VVAAAVSARDEILARIRGGLAAVPRDEGPADVEVPRLYAEREEEATVELFVERVADYGAGVHVLAPGEVADAVAAACRKHGATRLAVPADIPRSWLPPGVEAVVDAALPADELEAIGAALTGCALGIAMTGTVVLDGGPFQGRRALTLVPDLHLCVIEQEQVVDGVPSALRRLARGLREGALPVTFVSGPSATSDIELARVEGVHGPRRFELLLVRSPAAF
jgi:L-lactate dehydrogenase complex protein LldG